MSTFDNHFWKTKSLHEMTPAEWESLCDRCGICCLHKLEDKKTGKIYYTCVACRFLEIRRCRCSVYHDPYIAPADCIKITPENVRRLRWLPRSCAYRRIAEKKDLQWWHPLVSGKRHTVHQAGISIRDTAVSELQVHPEDIERFVVENI